ncbi:transcriptional regulator [Mycobacterium tuberculosis]|nr:transcriptional regulator [Mycobacterium tuberculosis]
MSRSVGAWNGSFDSGNRRTEARSWSRFVVCVNAPEFRLLTGQDPKNPKWIDAHANGLVAILLPRLAP